MCGSEIMYDADYFLRGRETGKSLYSDYRWLPDLTIPMVEAIISHCGIDKSDHILDFGCARGYIVRAFYELGYDAWGYDISEWALANCDSKVSKRLRSDELVTCDDYEWVIAKDVLEHVVNVQTTIDDLMDIATIGVFAVVPLSMFDGQPYIVSDYELDVTHIHRLTLASWARMFMRPGWVVTGSYMVPGVKANYQTWDWGNGFLVAKRLV